MIDIETRKIIDILDSREISDVVNWLKTYPNIKVVSRDGSLSYAAAIKEAFPSAIQVSDRFHLIKNLTDYCKSYFMKMLKNRIELDDNQKEEFKKNTEDNNSSYIDQLNFYSKMDKVNNVKIMKELGYSINKISDELHMDTRTIKAYLDIENPEEIFNKLDSPGRAKNATTLKKQRKIEEVMDLKEKGYNVKEIHEKTGYAIKTIKKYLDPNIIIENALGGYKKDGKLTPYHQDINELLAQGKTFKTIEEYILAKGYEGAASTIRMYVSRMRRLAKESRAKHGNRKEVIERKNIVKLLYKSINQIKEITEAQLKQLIVQHPEIGKIYDILSEFKVILSQKKINKLNLWIKKARELNLEEINSFIIGITRDLDAVKNAIIYEYSNGLAEGKINKLKVIKRIMYGRNNFDMLRKKILFLEKI